MDSEAQRIAPGTSAGVSTWSARKARWASSSLASAPVSSCHARANVATGSFGPITPGSESNAERALSSNGSIAASSSISERIRLCGGVRMLAPTTVPASSTTAK